MTCRGSRFADGAKRNPNGEVFMKNRETDEWLTQNNRSTRNFIRKWGHYCKHDTLMKPIVPPKYDIGFRVANVNEKILNMLEPWCNNISVETGMTNELINEYIKSEQPDTEFNIADKINNIVGNDIIVKFDANKLTQYSYQLITELSSILESSEIDIGEFELDIFKFNVNRLETYENELIKLN
tara:strand:- start:1797 stop:2345 length:549 start_codon:yes stop_codon:yes gene_type:complete